MAFDIETFKSQGRLTERRIAPCPECGGPAEVIPSGNKWRCTSFERDGITKILICGARGITVGDDLCVTRSSNGLWRDLVTEEG